MKTYPSSYDLRVLGRVTSARDQGPYGTCWAFASMGSLESGLLNSDPIAWDFSEDNLVWFAGFSLPDAYESGGNSFMALAYLARWDGPVSEADDPYADGFHPADRAPQRHLSEVVFVPPRSSSLDNDQIKAAVMAYGGVDVDMWWPDVNVSAYWRESTHGLYTYGTHTANHDVLIVGWDDTYEAGNFATSPPGPGAFIVKNSWGTDWGDGGYFYASYYDNLLACGGYNMAFAAAGPPDDYARAYQYDPLGYWPGDGPDTTSATGWFANVFTAAASEDLAGVGFYTPLPNCSYEVRTSATSGTPSFGGLQLRGSGTLATAGYHVVPLSVTVPLTSGQPFTVAVKLTASDASFRDPIPAEVPYPGYSDASSNPGESYVCTDGTVWRDITTIAGYGEANVCLKAFTKASGAPSSEIPATPILDFTVARTSGATDIVTLTWADVAAETGYEIQRATNVNFAIGLTAIDAPADATSATNTVAHGSSYFYRIRAHNESGASAWSIPIIVTTVPAVPTSLACEVQAGPVVALSWSDNATNETGFVVERSVNGGTFAPLTALPAQPATGTGLVSFADTEVAPGSSYGYRIEAVNEDGASAWSPTSTVAVAAIPATPILDFTVARTSGATDIVTLTWADVAAETGYEIQRATNVNFAIGLTAIDAPADATSATNTVAHGSSYFYRIRAHNESGASAWSVPIIVTTVPAVPANVRVKARTRTSITIAWKDPSANEKGYRIQRRRPTGTWKTVKTTGPNVTAWKNAKLLRAKAYQYRIRGFNGTGASSWSNTLKVFTLR